MRLTPLLLTLGILACAPLSAQGPGFTQPTGRQPGDIISTWVLGGGARTTNIGFHRGYLFTHSRGILGGSAGEAGAAVQVWNISNLSAPVRVGNQLNIGYPQHNFYMVGDLYTNALARNNPNSSFWDFSNPLDIRPAPATPYVAVPRGRRDWFSPPLHYIGQNGYHTGNPLGAIYDLRTGAKVAEIDFQAEIGFLAKPIVIGNLMLAVSVHTEGGVASYDVSDPANPRLLDILPSSNPDGTRLAGRGYEPCVYKHWVVLSSSFNEGTDEIRFVDFSDPADLKLTAVIPNPPGTNRYVQFQDDQMFVGDGKYDLTQFPASMPLVLQFDGFDEYNFPLGNLIVTATPGQGQARILVHQALPDSQGPRVGFHLPRADETGLPATTRVGLVIHESLNPLTLNHLTVQVRPVGGAALPGTVSMSDSDVVSFHPDVPLALNTTYEVYLPAGGIQDLAGNAIEEDFSFRFSTGTSVEIGNRAPRIDSLVVSAYPAFTGQSVQLSATVSDSDGDPIEVLWEFEGSPDAGTWTASTVANHTFTTPGHHKGTLRARDPAGSTATRAFTVTVVESVPTEHGVASSGLVHAPAQDLFLAVNPDHHTLAGFRADNPSRVFETVVGRSPQSVAIDADGFAWVTSRDDDRIDRVQLPGGQRLDSIMLPYGSAPRGILFGTDGLTGYVALSGSGAVVRFDARQRRVTGRIDAVPRAFALGLSPGGDRLYVTRFLSPDSAAEVARILLPEFTREETLTFPPFLDASVENGSNGRGVLNHVAAVLPSPFGARVWIAAKKDNIFRGGLRDGQPLTFETSVRAVVAPLDAVTGAALPEEAIDLDNSAPPVALAFSPLGDYLFAASQGNNEIEVIDAFSRAHIARFGTGLGPQSMAFDPVRRRLWVANFTGRTLSILDLSSFLEFGNPSLPEPVTITTSAFEPLSTVVLRGKRLFHSAKDLVDADLNPSPMSLDSYLSCAACHNEGGQDARVWDFTDRGEGLRNTISLQGRAGLGHGRLHWSANFDEVQDFENDIRDEFGGTGFLSDTDWEDPQIRSPLGTKLKAGRSSDLDALAAYVASLAQASLPRSHLREPDGRLTELAVVGLGVFQAANCAACHTGTRFTDAQTHDVGTLRPSSGGRLGGVLPGIDTPTLLGLFESAPYLHDGSAPTLEAVFERFDPVAPEGSDRRAHDLSAFTQQERAALIRYLLELDGHDLVTPTPNPVVSGITAPEAEHGVFPAGQTVWTITSGDPATSNSSFITTTLSDVANFPTGNAAALASRTVSYPFTVQTTGDQAVYARVRALSASEDSLFLRLLRPNGTRTGWMRWNSIFTTASNPWQWRRLGFDGTTDRPPTIINDQDFRALAPGAYALEVTYREPNLRIDRWVIQPASLPAPSGFGPEPVSPEEPTDWFHDEPNTTYSAWSSRVGVPAASGFTALLPESNRPAALAYAIGFATPDPMLGPDSIPGVLSFRFPRALDRTDLRYTVETSNDLALWTPVARAEPGAAAMELLAPAETHQLEQTHDLRLPKRHEVVLKIAHSGAAPLFARLAVEQASP